MKPDMVYRFIAAWVGVSVVFAIAMTAGAFAARRLIG